jgi:hypothetical protein
MVRFQSRRRAAGFFICIAVLGACGGKKEEGKPAGDKGGGASAAANKDLDVIPAESDSVFGLDLTKARQSTLFSDYALPAITKSGEAQRIIELLKSKCSIDPMTAAKRLTAGVKLAGSRVADVVAVLHGIEKGKALPCIDQVKDQLAAEHVEVTRDGDVVVLKGAQGELAFTFTGDTTAIVAMGSKATKEGVLELAQGKSMLKTSKEFIDMYGRLQTDHTLWFLVKGDLDMVAGLLDKLSVRSKAIYGSANTTNGLEFRGNIRVESEEQATNLAQLANSQAGMASKMADKFEVTTDKTDVRAHVMLTPQQLKNALGFAAPFLPR